MIDMLYSMLDPSTMKNIDIDEMRKTFDQFDAWITIFGSDDAVRAWHHLRQATFHDPPPEVFIRLYADVIMAARQDLGTSQTSVTRAELVGSRLRDLYSETDTLDLRTLLALEWPEVSEQTGWAAPWLSDEATPGVGRGRKPAALGAAEVLSNDPEQPSTTPSH
jgi:hypothetical protein